MGRKGVSKRKKSKEKSPPPVVAGSISASKDRKAENQPEQPEQSSEKVKSSLKSKKKR